MDLGNVAVKLRVRIYRDAYDPPSSEEDMEAVMEGCLALGDDCRFTGDINDPCDVAVHTSGLKSGAQSQSRLSKSRQVLMNRFPDRRIVLESPCFRRGRENAPPYRRIAWNGFLRDDSDYMIPDNPGAGRWEEIQRSHGIKLRSFRSEGDYILLLAQKPSDASLRGVDIAEWVAKQYSKLKSIQRREIMVRPHPLDTGREALSMLPAGAIISNSKRLEDDLLRSWCVVSLTSLAGIEAICDGVPVVCRSPGNLSWDVGSTNVLEPEFPDDERRLAWLHRLAWMQWTIDEIRIGVPWARLRTRLVS